MVSWVVSTIFTNVNNLCNIFLLFYDCLIFCCFTIFDSIKFVNENFITTTFYFSKPVIYLRGIAVSTKKFFQIRLTLISNSSDCENMIVLFVFSFFLQFLLLPHKRDLSERLVYQRSFFSLAFPIFPEKNS